MTEEKVIIDGILKNHYTWEEIDNLGINVYVGTISAPLGIVGNLAAIVIERKDNINYKGYTFVWGTKITYTEDCKPLYAKSRIDSIIVQVVSKGYNFDTETKTWSK